MPKMQLSARLQPLLKPKKFKIIYGGRGSGKSVSVADILLMRIMTEGLKVGAMREMMNSIDDSVHSLFVEEIHRLGLNGFTILGNKITHRNGGEITYKGLARNPESVKSMHGYSVFWVEEASTLSKKSIDLLIPTLRKEGSELWMTFNPAASNDPIAKEFLKPFEQNMVDGCYEDELYLIIRANHSHNPFMPQNLEDLRVMHKKMKSSAEYLHIWEGHYNDSVENSLIQADWFDACIDAHKTLGFEPRGIEVVSHDPSDIGADSKGLAYRHGVVIKDVQEMDYGDINQGGDWAIAYAQQVKPDVFVYDGDGMGVGLRRQFNEAFDGKRITIDMFKGSEMADRPDEFYEQMEERVKSKTNRQTFKNKRAQYYWELRDRCYKTYLAVTEGKYTDPDELISFSTEIENMDLLRSEICRIPLKHNTTGLIQIMTKPEMAKLGIASPNMADAVVMSLSAQVKKREKKARDNRRSRTGGWMAA